jgi:hypothetical protein
VSIGRLTLAANGIFDYVDVPFLPDIRALAQNLRFKVSSEGVKPSPERALLERVLRATGKVFMHRI